MDRRKALKIALEQLENDTCTTPPALMPFAAGWYGGVKGLAAVLSSAFPSSVVTADAIDHALLSNGIADFHYDRRGNITYYNLINAFAFVGYMNGAWEGFRVTGNLQTQQDMPEHGKPAFVFARIDLGETGVFGEPVCILAVLTGKNADGSYRCRSTVPGIPETISPLAIRASLVMEAVAL